MDRGIFTARRLGDAVRCFGDAGYERLQHVNSDDGCRAAVGVYQLHQDDHGPIMRHGAHPYEWGKICQ